MTRFTASSDRSIHAVIAIINHGAARQRGRNRRGRGEECPDDCLAFGTHSAEWEGWMAEDMRLMWDEETQLIAV